MLLDTLSPTVAATTSSTHLLHRLLADSQSSGGDGGGSGKCGVSPSTDSCSGGGGTDGGGGRGAPDFESTGLDRRALLLSSFRDAGVAKLPAVVRYIRRALEDDHKAPPPPTVHDS